MKATALDVRNRLHVFSVEDRLHYYGMKTIAVQVSKLGLRERDFPLLVELADGSFLMVDLEVVTCAEIYGASMAGLLGWDPAQPVTRYRAVYLS